MTRREDPGSETHVRRNGADATNRDHVSGARVQRACHPLRQLSPFFIYKDLPDDNFGTKIAPALRLVVLCEDGGRKDQEALVQGRSTNGITSTILVRSPALVCGRIRLRRAAWELEFSWVERTPRPHLS